MTGPDGLPYAGALDAVRRIETALSERDAAREATDSELEVAHAEAERLLSAACMLARGLERNDGSRYSPEPESKPSRSGPAAMPKRGGWPAEWPRHGTCWQQNSRRSCSSRSGDRMLVPMTKVRILGPRSAAEAVLGRLHRLGLVELADARTAHSLGGLDGAGNQSASSEELRLVLAQTDKLLGEWSGEPISAGAASRRGGRWISPELREQLTRLALDVEEVGRRLDASARRAVGSSHLSRAAAVAAVARAGSRRPRCGKLRLIGLATVAVVLNTDDERLVETLRVELAEQLGSPFRAGRDPHRAGRWGV